VFLPLYLVQVRGESSTAAGLVLSVGGFMWTVGSIVASMRAHGQWPMRMVVGGALLIAVAALSIAAQALLGDLPLPLIYVAWGIAGFGVGVALLHLMNWSIVFAPPDQSGAVSSGVQTMRMLGAAASGALMGAVLNAIGAGPSELPRAMVAVFALTSLIALWPATLGRPKVAPRS
jgi:predicted MFS family arabinose efflux permease